MWPSIATVERCNLFDNCIVEQSVKIKQIKRQTKHVLGMLSSILVSLMIDDGREKPEIVTSCWKD